MKHPIISRACLMVAVGLLATAPLVAQGSIKRDVVFTQEGDDCVLTGEPTRIRAKRNLVLVWRVTNECTREITVEVGNFKRDGQAVESPVDSRPVSVLSGERKTLRGIVRGAAQVGVYRYDVLLDGQQGQDPELVIDP